MRVVVLGAGVVGVTTAYYLSQLGSEVTDIDRASEPGDGASFGNAGHRRAGQARVYRTPAGDAPGS